MAKAIVTLKDTGPLSLTVGGRRFEKGQSQVITNDAEIARFKMEPTFDVQIDDEEPAPPPRLKAGKKSGKKSHEEDDESELDDEGDEDEGEGDEDSGPLTEEAMRLMNKKALLEAAKERGIKGVDESATKADMIAYIVNAQKE